MKNPSFQPRVLLVALAMLLAAPALWSCNSETPFQKVAREHDELLRGIDEDTIQSYVRRNNLQDKAARTASGLYVVSLINGQGTPVTAGRQVRVRYIGRFLSNGAQPGSSGYPASGGNFNFPVGSVFDNSTENRTSCGCAVFTAGTGAIAGFSEGLLLMRQGDRKLLLIPSRLAYGANGQVDQNNNVTFPRDAAVLFDIEVLNVY